MGRTGEVDFNRVLACVVVVAAHLAFFWVMTRKITLPLPAGDTGDALQLTWIEPPASIHVSCKASRSEEHTSELQSLMRISYAVFCLKKQNQTLLTLRQRVDCNAQSM